MHPFTSESQSHIYLHLIIYCIYTIYVFKLYEVFGDDENHAVNKSCFRYVIIYFLYAEGRV